MKALRGLVHISTIGDAGITVRSHNWSGIRGRGDGFIRGILVGKSSYTDAQISSASAVSICVSRGTRGNGNGDGLWLASSRVCGDSRIGGVEKLTAAFSGDRFRLERCCRLVASWKPAFTGLNRGNCAGLLEKTFNGRAVWSGAEEVHRVKGTGETLESFLDTRLQRWTRGREDGRRQQRSWRDTARLGSR